MIKLVCDRCGRELTEPYEIELALDGMEAWRASVRARGEEPRGVFPCESYARCGGEMIAVDDSSITSGYRKLKKMFGKK
jgi:hypothetical protein